MSDTVASRLGGDLVQAAAVDVGAARERSRLRRLRKLALVLGVPCAFLWYRIASGDPFNVFRLPSMPNDPYLYILPIAIVLVIAVIVAMPLMAGRSPHLEFRPEQIDVALDDVKGLDVIVDEVVKTLNTFLGYALYRDQLGGTPRRGLLFEGPPGTGKTHLAKAMAREAGVPFLFVSATSFQSMWYGATARKIRSFFRALRKTARREGGAIGFIEEIDAIATTRSGLRATPLPDRLRSLAGCSFAGSRVSQTLSDPGPLDRSAGTGVAGTGVRIDRAGMSESAGGVVNELLIQMQSFDTPPFGQRLRNGLAGWVNGYLPAHRQIPKTKTPYHNILVIAATNRADNLDPALVRPGRFDRQLSFELPPKEARRQIIDHFLDRKSHAPELDSDALRDQLAGQTFGYSPVMIEHLFDEALVIALKGGSDAFGWSEVQEARLTGEVGLKNPVPYTRKERRTVATHEAGHATIAFLAGTRRLEVLSIVKRRQALGLLAHGDLDEVYTRTKSEMLDLIDIAMGGMVAEETFFGESGTGPAGDLASATAVAAEIVGSAGMSGSLVSMVAIENGAVNQTNLVGRVLSDATLRPEVDRILTESKERVRAELDRNRHLVEALRDALLDRDELIGEEITDVLEAAGPVGEDLRVVHDDAGPATSGSTRRTEDGVARA